MKKYIFIIYGAILIAFLSLGLPNPIQNSPGRYKPNQLVQRKDRVTPFIYSSCNVRFVMARAVDDENQVVVMLENCFGREMYSLAVWPEADIEPINN